MSGANSKRQPELATFSETVNGRLYHLPISSALRMEDPRDRLSLAYNTCFAYLEVPEPSPQSTAFRFVITEMGRVEEAQLAVQPILKAGEMLEFAVGVLTVPLHPQTTSGRFRAQDIHSCWKR